MSKKLVTAPKKFKKRLATAIITVIVSLSVLSILNSRYYLKADTAPETHTAETTSVTVIAEELDSK